MKILSNNKGMALIITLILSLVSLGLLAALFFLITSGTKISGTNIRYITALEAAKGASEYVMDKLIDMDYTTVPDNGTFNLDSFSSLSNYNLTATVLNKTLLPPPAVDVALYSIRIEATRTGTNEKSIIEFVYKVQ